MAQRPLMLKEFLELDAISESCDGFICAQLRPDAATVRCLLDAELGGKLVGGRSKGALAKISAAINSVKLFSSSSSGSRRAQGRFLPRSFQKKLRRSFWKKRGEAEEEHVSRDRGGGIVRLRSLEEDGEENRSVRFPSPVVSSCSSWSDRGGSSGSDFLLSSSGSSACFGENAVDAGKCKGDSELKSRNPSHQATMDAAAGEDYREAAAGRREAQEVEAEGGRTEEKEQLSPVSVMDFPFHDEEGDDQEEEGTVSPSFHQSLANIERASHQLLLKIRRFESLAELDPVDLDDRFASSEEPLESIDHVASEGEGEDTAEEKRAWDLLRQLKSRTPWGPQYGSVEKLMLGFFVEGLSYSRGCTTPSLNRRRHPKVKIASPRGRTEEELLKAAGDWIGDGQGGGRRVDGGEERLEEMERSGVWRCAAVEEEGEVAADVEVRVLGWLLEELVLDLAPR